MEANFSDKATFYQEGAYVQKSASEVLLSLLNIQEDQSVLDVGCGPGNITRQIASVTSNRVIGIDSATGMIHVAQESYKEVPNLGFAVYDAAELDYNNEFDVVYCNSAFQWFTQPEKIMQNFFKALKSGGRIGVQAPATSTYCPNFLEAIDLVRRHEPTAKIFSTFLSPWCFLETAEDYKNLFELHGFSVKHCEIREELRTLRPEQVYQNFQVGAENGYLSPANYPITLSQEYMDEFRRIVSEAFNTQTDSNGLVMLNFKRFYLLAEKAVV